MNYADGVKFLSTSRFEFVGAASKQLLDFFGFHIFSRPSVCPARFWWYHRSRVTMICMLLRLDLGACPIFSLILLEDSREERHVVGGIKPGVAVVLSRRRRRAFN